MALDPVVSLAFSMQSNPGVYAVLLGSGVSRAANIPTGWGITLDLAKKAMLAGDAHSTQDPADWYRNEFKTEPDYSHLIELLAPRQIERQALLKSYFEYQDGDDEDSKRPTKAHRAIARLMKAGYIRLVITTNFDRLMETALIDEGVSPVVLSDVSHFAGAVPLSHLKNCVVKVHGDYQDTRIRNTETELASYPEEQNKFLERVFDEFGLVTCGWSGDWDDALIKTMESASSRRYSMYFSYVNFFGERAGGLCARRLAVKLAIQSADEFFVGLEGKIKTIERMSLDHEVNDQVLIREVKQCIDNLSVNRVRLEDIFQQEVSRLLNILARISDDREKMSGTDSVSNVRLLDELDSHTRRLMHVVFQFGRWGDAELHRVLAVGLKLFFSQRSAKRSQLQGFPYSYCATVLMYAGLLGAVRSENYWYLVRVVSSPISGVVENKFLGSSLVAERVLGSLSGQDKFFGDVCKSTTPISEHLMLSLGSEFSALFGGKEEFDYFFDIGEVLLSMVVNRLDFSERKTWGSDIFPTGRFHWKLDSLSRVRSYLFDVDREWLVDVIPDLHDLIDGLAQYVDKTARYLPRR